MCNGNLHPLLAALPKCEHHMHVEGALSPELLFELAAKNGVALPSVAEDPAFASPAALYARYDAFASLDDFLHYYYIGMSVLRTAADFDALATAYFARARAARVRHAEIFFDPQAHLARGVDLAVVVAGLQAACRRAADPAQQPAGTGAGPDGVVTSLLIPCLLRHLPLPDSARTAAALRDGGYWATAAAAVAAQKAGAADGELASGTVAGLGLCSSERDLPPTLWADIFRAAQTDGVASSSSSSSSSSGHDDAAPRGAPHVTAHAGEEGPPAYITAALDGLGAERIDHGVAAARDPAVLARLARDRVLLTVCPLSNVRLRGAASVADVPVRAFLDAGVPFSINSDDPAYFGGYILENYCAVQDAHGLAPADWETIARSAVRGSWCGPRRKQALLAEIDAVMAAWAAGTLAAPAAPAAA